MPPIISAAVSAIRVTCRERGIRCDHVASARGGDHVGEDLWPEQSRRRDLAPYFDDVPLVGKGFLCSHVAEPRTAGLCRPSML